MDGARVIEPEHNEKMGKEIEWSRPNRGIQGRQSAQSHNKSSLAILSNAVILHSMPPRPSRNDVPLGLRIS
jgi:hypothetical protein